MMSRAEMSPAAALPMLPTRLVLAFEAQREGSRLVADEDVDPPALADDRLAETNLGVDDQAMHSVVLVNVPGDSIAIVIARHEMSIQIIAKREI